MLARIVCSVLTSDARRSAPGGVVPGVLRASARTNARARDTASAAMPSHSDAQRMCETGCIVRDEMSAYGSGSTCAMSPDVSSTKPRLHVPRKPSVSQPVVCWSVVSALRASTITWSELAASGVRRAVTRMSSASSAYEITGAFLRSVKRSPSRATAQMLVRTSPPTLASVVAEASSSWRAASCCR